MGEDAGKPLNLELQGCIRPKPKENHAGMGMLEAEISYLGWGRAFFLNGMVGIGKTRFDILNCQFGIGGEQISKVRVIGKVCHDPLHRNPGAFDNRFPDHNIRIRRNASFVVVLFVCHRCSLQRAL
jgi:hypothetical protein